MAKVTIETIKKLREHTGAGVMEAKKALEESGGDEKKAVKLINKHGLVKAEKRAEREVPEGVIASYVHHGGKIATLLELKCETDFVARTEEFEHLSRELAMQVASMDPKNVDALLSQEYIRDPSKTIKELIAETVGKTGEKIEVKRFVRFELGEK
ncbi:translation elongation factor Ts [Patescibacteria group bacterium]|nr:translation elongation factor Ts [Patescibacteria group bacterium]